MRSEFFSESSLLLLIIMIWSCLSCFPSAAAARLILGRRKNPCQGHDNLPDDILTDILSRLPPRHVARCRMVSRRWKAVTSSPYFYRLHQKRTLPFIITQNIRKDLYMVKEWPWGATNTTERIRRVRTKCITLKCEYPPRPLLYLSSDIGLIVLLWNRTLFGPILNHFTIFNPTTKEKVEIFTPFGGHIYGVFFRPLLNEPCLLWGHIKNGAMQFKLLNLGLNSRWRKLRSSRVISHAPRLRTQEDYPFVDVVGGASSVTVDDLLYWMVSFRLAAAKDSSYAPCAESIMAFDIKTEEFSIMPHPGAGAGPHDHHDQWCKNDPGHFRMDLLAMDGFLSLIEHSSSRPSFKINIWILKDRVNRSWMKTHTAVDIGVSVPRFALRWAERIAVYFVAVVDGELLFRRVGRYRLFAYNLKLGTIRKFKGTRLFTEGPFFLSCAHTRSLVSRGNCNPEIYV